LSKVLDTNMTGVIEMAIAELAICHRQEPVPRV